VRLASLEELANVAFAVDDSLRFRYMNAAWFAFAQANGGLAEITSRYGLGADLSACLEGDLKDHLVKAWQRSLSSGQAFDYDYECSSEEVYRLFRQQVIPLEGGKGLLFINHQRIEQPHDQDRNASARPSCDQHLNERGLIIQCSFCRRVQRADQPEQWDWVPAWVAAVPDNTSHTYCPVCYDRYVLPLCP
jgi:hypothetical protein